MKGYMLGAGALSFILNTCEILSADSAEVI